MIQDWGIVVQNGGRWETALNRTKKAAALIAVLGLLSTTLLTGCDTPAGGGSGPGAPPADGPGASAAPPEYVIPQILVPSAPGDAVEENEKAVIDFSNAQDGYVMAKYRDRTEKQIRAIITIPDETEYMYRLVPGGGFEVFPLSGGDGEYTVRVFEQVEGTKYALVLTATIGVALLDEFAPFLRPNQYVDFNRDSEVVRKAAELTAGADSLMEKIAAVYDYVIDNIDYDFALAETVQSGYLPELDLVLERGLGICFDYAAVMTAMLRSQGIPAKLVIGYAGVAYHAWISVFSEETGWIDGLIFFDGENWRFLDPTFAATGDAGAVAEYIGSGTNYQAKFLY